MLADSLRVLPYKRAIERAVKKSDIICDLGAGSGILAFFAAKSGCRKVYALEKNAQVMAVAQEIAQKNDLASNIVFMEKDALACRLKDKIDLLLQEQIGAFIWDENMIAQLSYIRDNFMKRKKRFIPQKIEIFFVPTDYKSKAERAISFWSKKHYGIDLSPLGFKLFMERINGAVLPGIVSLKDSRTFLSKEKLGYTIDFKRESTIPHEINITFKLKKGAVLRGMLVFFKIYLDEKNLISTRPKKNNTHWGQIFLPCFQEKTVEKDSGLNFTLRPQIDPRKWKFDFEVLSLS